MMALLCRTKKVLVRDAKVGVIYFTTIICVILYIIVIAIVNDRGCVTLCNHGGQLNSKVATAQHNYIYHTRSLYVYTLC